MILPALDLGSAALANATLRASLDELAAGLRLVGTVALRDTTDAHAETIGALLKSNPGAYAVEAVTDAEAALALLNTGAARVTVAADILIADTGFTAIGLPKERVWAEIAAKAGDDLAALAKPVAEIAGGFHFIFPGEPDVAALAAFAKTRAPKRVSAAGAITTGAQVAALDKAGVFARVGAPLLDGTLPLADALAACLKTDRPDGLWSTVIADEHGVALGLAFSDIESLRTAVSRRVGAYHSRSRNNLWIKGASSGATQELLGVALDCDRDALRFTVRQTEPGFCHENVWSCWGSVGGLPALARLLTSRAKEAPAGSYTHRLLNDPVLLASKLREEAGELIEASAQNDRDEVVWEAADVIYFTLVHLAKHGVSLAEVERHLDARHLKVTRRKGDAKPGK